MSVSANCFPSRWYIFILVVDCGQPLSPSNGIVNSRCNTTAGSNCDVICKPGFDGPRAMFCNGTSGAWSYSGCKDTNYCESAPCRGASVCVDVNFDSTKPFKCVCVDGAFAKVPGVDGSGCQFPSM